MGPRCSDASAGMLLDGLGKVGLLVLALILLSQLVRYRDTPGGLKADEDLRKG